jgi:hypothetical protein
MILATRTKKARRNSRCSLCQQPVSVGQRIALLGRTWVHSACVADRITTTRGNGS